MSSLNQTVLFVGIGARGSRIAAELGETAAAIHEAGDPSHGVVTAPELGTERFQRAVRLELIRLLETGAGQTAGQIRLDVPVVLDATEVDSEALVSLIGVLDEVLRQDYPVVFPPAAPSAERSLWITLHLSTPALVQTETGVVFARLLAGLQQLATTTTSISRILLLPRQTAAGGLDEDAMEESLRALLQALYLSGSRDHDPVRRVLAHRSDAKLVATVGIATAEVPVARIRRYARWRLALCGLATLSEQAEQPILDSSRVDTLFQQLDTAPLLDAFDGGETAVRVRARAAKLSGAADSLPDKWKIALTDREAEIRRRYRVLFEPIAKPWNRRTDPTTDPDHEAMLRAVDRAEFDALKEADRRVVELLDEELDPRTALSVLPAVEHALKQVLHDLDEELAREVPTLPSPEPPAPPDDPGLTELARTVDSRPGFRRTWVVLLVLMLGVGGVAMLGTSWFLANPLPVGATSSAPLPPTRVEAWVLGGFLGMATAALWQIGVLFSWRQTAARALERRTHELAAAWRRGGAGQERDQAEQLLAVHRRRTAHDLHRRFSFALERLASLRAAIRQSTLSARAALVDLNIRPGAHPKQDDLSGLLPASGPLHHSLVEPNMLHKVLESTDALRDPDRWAAHILAGTWPTRSGLTTDLPCADEHQILQNCDEALGPIRAEQLLVDAAPAMRSFLSQAPGALGWGIEPRDAHGDPVRGIGRDQRFVLAPRTLRIAVEGALADSPVQLAPVWSESNAPWVSVISAWDGFSADDVVRGMGISL